MRAEEMRGQRRGRGEEEGEEKRGEERRRNTGKRTLQLIYISPAPSPTKRCLPDLSLPLSIFTFTGHRSSIHSASQTASMQKGNHPIRRKGAEPRLLTACSSMPLLEYKFCITIYRYIYILSIYYTKTMIVMCFLETVDI